MRKLIAVFVLTLLFVGCERKYSTEMVAVFSRASNDDGLLVLLDDEANSIKDIQTIYPLKNYIQDEKVYLSYDEKKYLVYNCYSGKKIGELNGVNGDLLYVDNKGNYVTSNAGYIYFFNNNNKPVEQIECDYSYYIGNACEFYVVDQNKQFYYFNDGVLMQQYSINSNNNYLSFALINGQVYLVSDNSYTLMDKGQMKMTYLILENYDVIKAKNDLLFAYQDDELVCLRVSFSQFMIEFTPVYDEKYYREINFENEFSSYYENGYEIENICIY